MEYSSFGRLLRVIAPSLEINIKQSMRSSHGGYPLCKTGMLQAYLRWLAGGKVQDIRIITGVSMSTFYRLIRRVMAASNNAKELGPVFPLSEDQMQAEVPRLLRKAHLAFFKDVSARLMVGYARFAYQNAISADELLLFSLVIVNGGMNDVQAFKQWTLSSVLDRIDDPYFVVGDNPYTQSRVVMTPNNQSQLKGKKERDIYNFYVSQLRIRVEMAFGILVNKWCILKNPLAIDLNDWPSVIVSCIRLHNFCINERLSRDDDVDLDSLLQDVRQTTGSVCVAYSESQEEQGLHS
ncbi:hypothetical protein Poli38472_014783 [Pythium oligandrum]|uniref:DDE Tnp4 domain-containing protein n=1 Tax=Pythium oligandrum TaxID=41045 RepID=A0A8K1CJ41_PYTOL|nr:hypothetical protein Poli38472_014783 [Pythium oligandrum]|eukprot:TMW63873.1 hypothetical protein Poli38472_014783 [Pythium oligandrum]